MPSIVYNSFYHDCFSGSINCASDSFKCALVTSAYTPSKAHSKFSDVTGEVSGAGYTAGGNAATCVVDPVDNTADTASVRFTFTDWTAATITARGCVDYKSRGGAATADELVCFIDFGLDVSSTAATFSVKMDDPVRVQN